MQILRFESEDGAVYTGCDYDGQSAALIEGDIFNEISVSPERKKVVRFLTPIDPRVIFCIGLNYRDHIAETGMKELKYPTVFMKNVAAATPHQSDIILPAPCLETPEVDYEAELCVVIKTAVKNVSIDDALDCVLGYTCANDVSARRWQKHAGGGQWAKGKGFDTFCPFGPWLVTTDELRDPGDLEVSCVLNGETMQKCRTSQMIFSVPEIISFLSQSTTLLPGTIILTGTPSGVGFTRTPPVYLQPGDEVKISVEGIGTLENRVVEENSSAA